MTLYLIHCGFYDEDISDAIYEFHINIPIAARDLTEAREKVRQNPSFKRKKMHIDGIQEIKAVDGFDITLVGTDGETNQITNIPYRDL